MSWMQNGHEYLWQIVGHERNFMLESGSNRIHPELPNDAYWLFLVARFEKLGKPWLW